MNVQTQWNQIVFLDVAIKLQQICIGRQSQFQNISLLYTTDAVNEPKMQMIKSKSFKKVYKVSNKV